MRMIFATAAAALLLSGAAQAVTIANGSFESGSFTGAGFDTLSAGDSSITDWTVGGAGIDWIGNYWQPSDGARSIDLSAISAGSLSQAITTEIGQRYAVTFDLAGNPDGGPFLKLVDVTVNGGQSGTFAFTTGATSRAAMGWVGKTYRFTATSTSSVLAFTSQINTPSGPALDNVSISAIPEAATWAMLIAGFGMVGVASRRRRSVVAA
jgi:choice-of-anchor C domain-containing protein